MFSICNHNVQAGERLQTMIPVPGLPDEASIPLVIINGAHEGPTLTILAGVHGFEYGSIGAAVRLARDIDPSELHGQLVIATVVNRTAFDQRSIYVCPLDGKNLNRVFPGSAQGSASEQLAHFVFEQLIQPADAVVDLHAGDAIEALVPFSIYHREAGAEVVEQSLAMAQAYGLPYLLASSIEGSSYSSAAAEGIPAIIAEVGGQGIFSADATGRHYQGLRNLLRHLNLLDEELVSYPQPQVFQAFTWAYSEHQGLYYPHYEVGDELEKGAVVGEIKDYFGEVIQEVQAPASGPVLFGITSLAIKEGDPLMGIADLDGPGPDQA